MGLALRALWALIPKALIAALLVAVAGYAGYVSVELSSTRSDLSKTKITLADERTDRAKETAQRALVVAQAQENFRKTERLAYVQAQENADAVKKAVAARDVSHRLELADHDQLLHDTEAFIAAGGSGGAETCTADLRAERDKSATLGHVFEEADDLAGEMANAAERHADEVRGLKRQLELDREVK